MEYEFLFKKPNMKDVCFLFFRFSESQHDLNSYAFLKRTNCTAYSLLKSLGQAILCSKYKCRFLRRAIATTLNSCSVYWLTFVNNQSITVSSRFAIAVCVQKMKVFLYNCILRYIKRKQANHPLSPDVVTFIRAIHDTRENTANSSLGWKIDFPSSSVS